VTGGEDLVGVALRGVAVAVCAGTALAALTLWGVQRLMAGTPASDAPVTSGPAPVLLLLGTLGALGLSAAIAWRRLAPVDSYYRRGGLALVSVFATFVMAVLAAPLHHFAGSAALLGLAALAATGAALLARR
jgi:hypothetical protein